MSVYSDWKVAHHREQIDALRRAEQITPLHVELILTNRCNHRCTHCAYRTPGYPSSVDFHERDELPTTVALGIVADSMALGARAMQFTGGGEPTLHPEAPAIMRAALDAGLECALVTNGSGLDRVYAEALRMAWVRVSIDAGGAKVHEGIHRSKDFQRIADACQRFARDQKRRALFGMSFIATPENATAAAVAVEFAETTGFDNIRLSLAFGLDSDIQGVVASTVARRLHCVRETRCKVIDLTAARHDDAIHAVQDYGYCGTKEFTTYIGADQNVYACCTLAYNLAGRIGSLKHQSFAELWRGTEKQAWFRRHEPRVNCRLPCQFRRRNLFIGYLLEKDPIHVNFV